MKYVALKPCNFGRQFFIGDNIPTEAIDPCMVNSLAELSRLSKAELVAEGEKLGLAFGDKTTNKEIIEAILKLQQ